MLINNKISFNIEKNLIKKGMRIIAGVDEAGRGSLAGPLSIGLAIYDTSIIYNPPDEIIDNINDSKKLTPSKRKSALNIIHSLSHLVEVIMVPHRVIDDKNVNGATLFALKKLLAKIPVIPDVVIMDGKFSFDIGIPIIPVIKGDNLSFTIASASIIAKVTRDRVMEKFGDIYPDYGFKKHKGYGTKEHIAAIKKFGPCPIHRRSYEPVRGII
jgi:ribonuclease HII